MPRRAGVYIKNEGPQYKTDAAGRLVTGTRKSGAGHAEAGIRYSGPDRGIPEGLHVIYNPDATQKFRIKNADGRRIGLGWSQVLAHAPGLVKEHFTNPSSYTPEASSSSNPKKRIRAGARDFELASKYPTNRRANNPADPEQKPSRRVSAKELLQAQRDSRILTLTPADADAVTRARMQTGSALTPTATRPAAVVYNNLVGNNVIDPVAPLFNVDPNFIDQVLGDAEVEDAAEMDKFNALTNSLLNYQELDMGEQFYEDLANAEIPLRYGGSYHDRYQPSKARAEALDDELHYLRDDQRDPGYAIPRKELRQQFTEDGRNLTRGAGVGSAPISSILNPGDPRLRTGFTAPVRNPPPNVLRGLDRDARSRVAAQILMNRGAVSDAQIEPRYNLSSHVNVRIPRHPQHIRRTPDVYFK